MGGSASIGVQLSREQGSLSFGPDLTSNSSSHVEGF